MNQDLFGVPALVYNGHPIADHGEMLSLTDMWRAAGSDEARRPVVWLRSADGRRFVEFLAETQNVKILNLLKVSRGRGGETFAHWQIALAYAKYLSPEFHMWCNEVVRERMEALREADPLAIPPDFTSDVATKSDLNALCKWQLQLSKVNLDEMADLVEELRKEIQSELYKAERWTQKNLLAPESLAKAGVRFVPALTPETTFLTVHEIACMVVPEERRHRLLGKHVGLILQPHALRHRWQQGITAERSPSQRGVRTYPQARAEEWLASGGAEQVEAVNRRLFEQGDKKSKLRLV